MKARPFSNTNKSPFTTLIKTVTQSEQETFDLGQKFAGQLHSGDVVALFGELGSGKTRFIQGICRGLGVEKQVTSPTFTLINEYRAPIPVYHFDFFRITTLEDALALGTEEYFDKNGICLIEWADRVVEILPPERFEVYLYHNYDLNESNKREIEVRQILDTIS